jgi:4'-phosphopantetheinyl transferase
MQTPELQVSIASPQHIREWLRLSHWLAPAEQEQAARLRFEDDRRAYVVAHALRRAMVAAELRMQPARLSIRTGDQGQPVVDDDPQLFTSLSHTRHAVACAMTRVAPVGIDVEAVEPARADDELLEPFIQDAAADDFFGQWTALEAFWKCKGTGLADENPRIRLVPLRQNRSEVRYADGTPAGQVVRVHRVGGCAIAVALDCAAAYVPRLRVLRCSSTRDIEQLCGAAPVENFFTRLGMGA